MNRNISTKLALTVSFLIALSYNACSPFSAIQNETFSSNTLLSMDDTSTKACAVSNPGVTKLRRLNQAEYKYSVQDIFGITIDPTTDFPPDQTGTDNFATTSDFQSLSPERLQAFVDAAEQTVTAAMTANSPILICKNQMGGETCPSEVLSRVASRAWHRPLTSEDVADLNAIVLNSVKVINSISGYSGNKSRDALGVALQAILVSPRFLFLVDPYQGSGAIDQYSFAARLSYFLWSSVPDDELMQLAAQGKFSSKPVIVTQVRRMLSDKKATRFAQTFADRWLALWNLSNGTATDDLHKSLITETEMFFESVMRSDMSVTQLMEAEYTFVNSTLAQNYGISGATGTAFQKVSTVATGRKGLLSQGSLLMQTSDSLHSKPTARGHFILSNITCTPPPPFPDGVGISTLASDDPNQTVRQKLAVHRQGACAACHVRMDAIGLGLEMFDQFGKLRQNYLVPAVPVDASGDLYNSHFVDHRDLSKIIVDNRDYGRCVSKKMLSYATGRSIASVSDDRCMYEEISTIAAQRTSKFSELITAIVTSDAFLRNGNN